MDNELSDEAMETLMLAAGCEIYKAPLRNALPVGLRKVGLVGGGRPDGVIKLPGYTYCIYVDVEPSESIVRALFKVFLQQSGQEAYGHPNQRTLHLL